MSVVRASSEPMTGLALLDTTIRDGELSPAFNPNPQTRLEIASCLDQAGVDIIELASTADNDVRLDESARIAASLANARACCIAEMSPQHVTVAREVLKNARQPRIHLYLDARRVHLMTREPGQKQEIMALVRNTIESACRVFPEVQFSPQDASRADTTTLIELISVAIAAGAQTINISDTTGTATVTQIAGLFETLHRSLKPVKGVVLSLHAHNHEGNAGANAIAAIEYGAGQIEGTINGVGPAGGNTDLIDLLQRLHARADWQRRLPPANLAALHQLGQKQWFALKA